VTLEDVLELRRGKKVVFTNGVFDILHAGHVHYLAQARLLGDMLIVGLNSDASARGLAKGPERPLNGEEDRAAVLRALRSVDGVVLFEESWPERLIRSLRPEVYVKGGDYDASSLPETPLVESYGGEVRIIPFLEGRSTTTLVERIRGGF
jgi:rfaE bifunctional protein nucleotidyltransferase chain/domain